MADSGNSEIIKAIKKLEKEMVDAHNMSIKTETNLRNLYAELKRIVENQERAARASRWQSYVAYILFVVIISAGAIMGAKYYAASIEVKMQTLQKRLDEAEQRLAELTKEKEERKAAQVQAWALYKALKENDQKEALKVYKNLNRKALGKTLLAVLDSRISEIKDEMARRSLKEGIRLYRVGNYTNAIRELSSILKMNPEFEQRPKALYYIGFSQFNLKNYKEALKYLEEATRLAPDADEAPRARFLYGLCMEFGGNKEEALEYFQQLLRTPGKNPYRSRIRDRINAIRKAKSKRPASKPKQQPQEDSAQ